MLVLKLNKTKERQVAGSFIFLDDDVREGVLDVAVVYSFATLAAVGASISWTF